MSLRHLQEDIATITSTMPVRTSSTTVCAATSALNCATALPSALLPCLPATQRVQRQGRAPARFAQQQASAHDDDTQGRSFTARQPAPAAAAYRLQPTLATGPSLMGHPEQAHPGTGVPYMGMHAQAYTQMQLAQQELAAGLQRAQPGAMRGATVMPGMASYVPQYVMYS
jgi:hypothetical protein